MKRRTLSAALCATPIALALPPIARATTSFIHIGSGSTAGLYYPTAVGMADIVNDSGMDMRAYVRTTGASVENCLAVGSGELQMGLTQNNIAYYAYNGRGVADFDGKPQTSLRGLLMLYPEVIQILTRKLAGIASVADLRGKRVYVGDRGSGTREDVTRVLATYNVRVEDLRAAVHGNSADAVNLLVDGQIDAMFYTVGLGAGAITQAVATGEVDLLGLPTERVATLSAQFPFYTAFQIPAGTYRGINHAVSAVTLKAMLVGSAQLPDPVVHDFMKTVFGSHLQRFQDNPRNPNLKKYFSLATALEGMPIPLHPGAVRFFREQGVPVPPDLAPVT